MEQGHVNLAVLSNVGTVDADLAMKLARESNDHVAEVVRGRPDKFAAFATTPLQRPAEGADEL